MPKIYVGTYAKYNAGNLFGKWIDLEDMSDRQTFYEACQELHEDEVDPELMFQDWEDIPDNFITESSISIDFWDYMDCPIDEEVKLAYMTCFDEWDADKCEERYAGHHASWEDMAEDYLESSGQLNEIPKNLRWYFDYEKYGRDMQISGDMCEENGYFFNCY